ncbi:Cubilin [Stylophora pistillata]|uniref:Cubilin n=1 Tax=Stylophora pistillata TaxID=50429 RepID=A0A2B4RPB9_STYPI|nr:Cubilin [Stylophora pistillata]
MKALYNRITDTIGINCYSNICGACLSKNSLDENRNIVLKNPSGVITSPEYPSSYPRELIKQCFWKILAPEGNILRVDFLSFRLPPYGTCLTIFFTINRRIPTQTRVCGLKPSFLLYSMTNEIGIEGSEGYGFEPGQGFMANYTTIPAESSGVCIPSNNTTVHMEAEGMTFATPGFPLYPGKGQCNWNISVSEGNLIKLTFLSLFTGTPCDYSYVEIFDTANSTRTSLKKFCDVAHSDVEVYSRGSSLLVTHVNLLNASTTVGFLATYETVKSIPAKYACAKSDKYGLPKTLRGTDGEFASYQFPLSYSNDAKCSWTIEVPAGFIVNLTFHTFELQKSRGCAADYVEIKQGKSYLLADELLGRFCGSSIPAVIQSNRSVVRVDFVADSSGRYPGFHASFKAVPDPAMGPCKTQGIDNVIPLSGKTGRLFSPLYPETFPNDMRCTWIISVPEGHFVKLRITSFLLAYVCKQTTLEIRDGQSSSSDLLRNFCGSSFERSVFSSGRHLWVRFHSDKDEFLYGTGFDAFFEMVSQLPAPFSCTAGNLIIKLKSETGTLASYNYPLPSDDSVECIWSISVDTDSKIVLSFEFFNVSQTSHCSEDYVEVQDGWFSTSDLVGKYCGGEKPSQITSDSWNLRVAFKSSGKTKFPGFKATYKTKKAPSRMKTEQRNGTFGKRAPVPAPFSCTAQNSHHGIELKSKTGILVSYNYPVPVDDSVMCMWSINVDADYNIRLVLSFDFFNLSQAPDCSEDYVEASRAQSLRVQITEYAQNQVLRYLLWLELQKPKCPVTTNMMFKPWQVQLEQMFVAVLVTIT